MNELYTITSSTYLAISAVGIAFLVYGAMGQLFERFSLTSAMFFTLTGGFVGPLGVDAVSSDGSRVLLRVYAELTLALVLCTQAARIDFRAFRRVLTVPLRLLSIGLPASMMLGFVLAVVVFPDMIWLEAAILSVILAPTDADLARPITSTEGLPEKVILGVEIESGMNDGLCLPLLLALAALTLTSESRESLSPFFILEFLASEFGVGLLVGVILSIFFVGIARGTHGQFFVGGSWRVLPFASLALSSFGVAQWLGGSGLIASFAAGCVVSFDDQKRRFKLIDETESLANIVSSLAWIAFGVLLVPLVANNLSGSVVIYAFASVFLVRTLSVLISLGFSGMPKADRLFMAWFGPKGLATVAFMMLLVDRGVISERSPITSVVALTVACSIFLHGISAKPLSGFLLSHVSKRC
ncbi:K(+)/H(+) antiporter NhaP2 [Halomonas sp. THAF5a]|uniref:cation:proton antiporter domain-containing protein n=1 Tax=Halomonas sp. THAF5a TaxID=2587844 RepID=UPI00126811FD|nr:cation:proton antiporter [Halomonas sp. THAF5a]QFU01051.1 K(+)/H(+) antiporter NhaP2 [Halomonas sp. THAF5a]